MNSQRHPLLAFAIAIAAASAGCAHSNYQHLEPSAESLAVQPTYTEVPRYVSTRYTNADGTPGGSAATLVGQRARCCWSGFSISAAIEAIDEEDFYHLAKDKDGLDAVERARASGALKNRIGVALMAASLSFAIGLPVLTKRENAEYSVGQAFITFPTSGMALAYLGKKPFESPVNSAKQGFAALGDQPATWTNELDR